MNSRLQNAISAMTSSNGNYNRRRPSISSRTRSRMNSMNNTFDPYMLGRSLRNKVDSFVWNTITGKKKDEPEKGKSVVTPTQKKNNPLYTKISASDERPAKKNDSLSDVMSRIFNLMLKESESNKKKLELSKNFAQEQEDDSEKRHKELLKALSGLSGGTVTKVEEKKSGGFFGDIFDKVKKMVEGLLSDFLKQFEDVLKFVRGLMKSEKFLKLLSGLGSMAGLLALAGVASAAALLYLLANDTNPEATTKGIISAGSVDGGMAESIMAATEKSDENAVQAKKNNLLANRESSEKSFIPWKDSDLQKDYLNKIGWDEKSGTTAAERSSGATSIDQDGNLVYKKKTAVPVGNPSSGTPKGIETQNSSIGTKGSETPTSIGTQNSPPASVSATQRADVPSATPMPAEPGVTSQKLQSAISENKNLELNDTLDKGETIIIDKSKKVVGGGAPGPAVTIEGSAPVRIDDPTLKYIQERNLRKF